MKLKAIWTLALLCAVAQGFGAQITVKSEQELKDAITNGATNIQLTENILLENYLDIDGKTVTIDLNGYKLYRNLSSSSDDGHIFWIQNNGNLTLADNSSKHSGSIEGGNATNGGGINVWPGCSLTVSYVTFKDNSASNNGGAIFVRNGASVTLSNATFIGNFASDHAGAIWNNGTLSATDCTFTNNRAKDVGGIYNSVTETDGTTYAGVATLKDCTFERNAGTAGAGALANAMGDTEMTIEDCTIENNSAYQYGAGIWNGGTLNAKGAVKVTGNKNDDGMFSNLYLKNGKVITVTDDLNGSNIGVDLESISGRFTSGYNTHHSGVDPANFFSSDRLNVVSLGLDDNGEASLLGHLSISYIERSWDEMNKEVVSTQKRLIGAMIGYNATPIEGQFKDVTNAPDNNPDEWFGMGGFSDNVPEFYVVRENVNRETIVVQGKNVHLILCDGATLTLTGGLRLEGDFKLYIHSQSYGGDMGRLIVTNKYEKAAGIGSARHNDKTVKVGELVIYGGHIEATGGSNGAGIGSCSKEKQGEESRLCNRVSIYGGYVKAKGGGNAAGIGGGANSHEEGIPGGDYIQYDGTVIAEGGHSAGIGGGSGVGGGGGLKSADGGYGGEVTVYGGTLTATGSYLAAGIGSGYLCNGEEGEYLRGGIFRMYGGTVTATGGNLAAGIGGGTYSGGAIVTVYGGTVTATGGEKGAGIGGGDEGCGGVVKISGGTVTATGGEKAAGIGGGQKGDGGDVTITGGIVIAKAGKQGGEQNRAIGPGYNSAFDIKPLKYGTLTIGDAMMVGAGNNGSVESIFDADERKNACWFRSYAEISPCTHPEATYTIDGTDVNGTHTLHCSHCATQFKAEPHDFNGTDECSVCHWVGDSYRVTIYLPDANDDDTYAIDGKYKTYIHDLVAGSSFTLPGAPQDLQDMEFAGWLVIPTTDVIPSFSTYKTSADETLLPEKSPYTLNENVNFIARYKDIAISLADDSDNAEKLYNYDGKKATSVTLTGRTLYKDGKWNTLCLPFSLTAAQVTAQLAPDGLKTLSGSDFKNGTLTLTFTNASEIEAGKPYIIKWTGGSDIVGPTFSGVTISNATAPVETKYVDFVGTYSPIDIFTEYKTNLYLGANDKLYYPAGEDSFIINSCRAFFQLKEGLTAGEPVSTEVQEIKSFVLNFGEETGISEISKESRSQGVFGGWYSLDGRRIIGKPAAKGVYIYNGRKMIIK